MASLGGLHRVVLACIILQSCAASEYFQQDIGSSFRIGANALSANQYYRGFKYHDVTASWQHMLQKWPVKPEVYARHTSRSCEQLARTIKEDFAPSMLTRNRRVTPWLGTDNRGGVPHAVPKALCRLGSDASRFKSYEDFLSARSRLTDRQASMIHRYKILQGRLYRPAEREAQDISLQEEMLLLAVYLYKLPDMDFYLSWADEPLQGMDVLQYAMDFRTDHSGCGHPYPDNWFDALTVQQSVARAACIAHRFPAHARARKAVWRGSTTDTNIQPINMQDALKVTRIRLHMLGLVHHDILDAKVAAVIQTSGNHVTQPLSQLLGTEHRANYVPFENFQRSAVVIDIDGNSFSRRFVQLVQMGGPVLKQASPFPSYMEHLFAPGVAPVHLFAGNLSDLAEQAEIMLSKVEQAPRPNEWDQGVDSMHAVAAITLNRWSMIESVAYSLNELGRRMTWQARLQPGWSVLPWSSCCRGGGGLPAEFLSAMRDAERMEAHRTHKPAVAAPYADAEPAAQHADAEPAFERQYTHATDTFQTWLGLIAEEKL